MKSSFLLGRPGQLVLFFCMLHQSLSLQAADLGQVRAGLETDIRKAVEELGSLRQQTAQEKGPMIQERQALESEIAILDREMEQLRTAADSTSVGLEALRRDVEAREKEVDYVLRLMDDYVLFFESRVHIAELSLYRKSLDEAMAEREAEVSPDQVQGFSARFGVLDTAQDRVQEMLGGRRFEGRALLPSGTLVEGRYAILGPLAFFSGAEAGTSGVAELEANSLEAVLRPASPAQDPGIRSLVQEGRGQVPLDVTGGKAWTLNQRKESLWQHILQGGVVMVPILLLALLSLVLGLLKWMRLAGIRVPGFETSEQIIALVRQERVEEAVSKAGEIRGPLGELLQAGVRHAREEKDLLEEILVERILLARTQLERTLPFLALTAAISPLLGLLGTVIGMIHTFKLITLFGTGDARTLSSGISEALITTEFGLVVAVSALLLHALLSRKVKGIVSGMERTAIGFVNGVSLQSKDS